MATEGLSDPSTEHERYVVEEVAPRAHGLDPDDATDLPPPTPEHVATITA